MLRSVLAAMIVLTGLSAVAGATDVLRLLATVSHQKAQSSSEISQILQVELNSIPADLSRSDRTSIIQDCVQKVQLAARAGRDSTSCGGTTADGETQIQFEVQIATSDLQ